MPWRPKQLKHLTPWYILVCRNILTTKQDGYQTFTNKSYEVSDPRDWMSKFLYRSKMIKSSKTCQTAKTNAKFLNRSFLCKPSQDISKQLMPCGCCWFEAVDFHVPISRFYVMYEYYCILIMISAHSMSRAQIFCDTKEISRRYYRWYPAKRALPAMLTHGR